MLYTYFIRACVEEHFGVLIWLILLFIATSLMFQLANVIVYNLSKCFDFMNFFFATGVWG